jgi:Lrp/AsnC family transcriptional regulator for asnA, asnC and gidA
VSEGRVLDDLDPIDLAIVELLQQQGRTPNAQIARLIGVSEPTVRKRIDRLVQDDIIKVVAVLNPRKTGYATDVLIGVRTETGRLRAVGDALGERDDVVYLGYTTGRYDLLVELLFRDDEQLFRFIEEDVPMLGGIVSTETFHVLRTGKINYDWKMPEPWDRVEGDGKAGRSRVRADSTRERQATSSASSR